jgi:hypothetical protein
MYVAPRPALDRTRDQAGSACPPLRRQAHSIETFQLLIQSRESGHRGLLASRLLVRTHFVPHDGAEQIARPSHRPVSGHLGGAAVAVRGTETMEGSVQAHQALGQEEAGRSLTSASADVNLWVCP